MNFHYLNNYLWVVDTSEQTEYNSEQSKNSLEEITSEQIENESTDLDLCSRKKDSWSELNSSTTLYGKKRCGKIKLNSNPFILLFLLVIKNLETILFYKFHHIKLLQFP